MPESEPSNEEIAEAMRLSVDQYITNTGIDIESINDNSLVSLSDAGSSINNEKNVSTWTTIDNKAWSNPSPEQEIFNEAMFLKRSNTSIKDIAKHFKLPTAKAKRLMEQLDAFMAA